jgi:GntR family transcriptional repressor for pyruvate dehydrogenase complex
MIITKSSDLVIRNLLDLVVRGRIRPGDKLPSTKNLAQQMGVSVVSAREAVQSLATIGLLEISHGRGIFLTEGAPVIEELLEARKVIESYNAMMAAQNADENALAPMKDLLDEMDKSIASGDLDAYSEADYAFHLLIGKAACNRILFKTLENVKDLLRYQQSVINRLPNIVLTSKSKHWELFQAIRQGDPESARRIMAEHITEVIDSWKGNAASLEAGQGRGGQRRAQGPMSRGQRREGGRERGQGRKSTG